tara:strand:+ start:368 stop:985 length:618 start_codon:yes stop_codon:yes gene_type:complete
MKIYALIHGVCGMAEGYSETECYFHKDKASAAKDQSQWLSVYTEAPHEEVIISADRDEFIIVRNDDEGDHVILRIVELHPMWDTGRDADNVTAEWFCWNQMDNESMYGDESAKDYYLPTDMGVIQESMDWLGRDSTVDLEMYQEFVAGVYYRSHTFIDADDVAIHCYRLPKFHGGLNTNTKRKEIALSEDIDFNEVHEQHKQFAK